MPHFPESWPKPLCAFLACTIGGLLIGFLVTLLILLCFGAVLLLGPLANVLIPVLIGGGVGALIGLVAMLES